MTRVYCGNPCEVNKVTITDAVSVVNIILNIGEATAPAMESPAVEAPEVGDPEKHGDRFVQYV